jgi:hypothetical protein
MAPFFVSILKRFIQPDTSITQQGELKSVRLAVETMTYMKNMPTTSDHDQCAIISIFRVAADVEQSQISILMKRSLEGQGIERAEGVFISI